MKEDVIRQIKTAEEQAEGKIEHARAQAEKILHDARHQAVEIRMEIVEAARRHAKQQYEDGLKAFEPEVERVRQQFHAEIEQDSAQAQQKLHDVVDFVVTAFREQLGNK